MKHSIFFYYLLFFLFSDTYHYCQLLLPFPHCLPELSHKQVSSPQPGGMQDRHGRAFSENQSWHTSLCCRHPAHTQPTNGPVTNYYLAVQRSWEKTTTTNISANPSPFVLLKGIKTRIILFKLIFSNDFFFPACCCLVAHQAAIQLLLISCARHGTNWMRISEAFVLRATTYNAIQTLMSSWNKLVYTACFKKMMCEMV